MISAAAFAQGTRTITGTVLDEKGEPLTGAIIADEAGKQGVMADGLGIFSIKIPSADKFIVVSFLGYDKQNVDVSAKSDVKVIMVPDQATTLNEVVVIGYGEVKRRDLTGSVASVSSKDLENAATLSVDEALQGRIAGVDVMSTTGEPGASTSIRVRGTRSITASNEPLIVVDGVIDAVSDMSDINSDDIESISVLKDASSTAIYGARGSNGVVIITTKKGVTTKPSVTVSAEYGVAQLAKKLDIMNKEEFLRYRNEYAYHRYGATSPPRFDPANPSYSDTDWQDEVTRLAHYQNYRVGISGKTGQINYYASVGYTDKQGIIDDSGVKRATARLNLGYKPYKWLSLRYQGAYTFTHNNPNKVAIGGKAYYNGVVYLSPIIGPYDHTNPLYENGSRIDTPRSLIDYVTMINEYHSDNNSIELKITPVKGLTIKSQNAYNRWQTHRYQFWPSSMPKKIEGEGADALRYEYDKKILSSENTVTYANKSRKGHNYDVLVGYTSYMMRDNNFQLKAVGLLVDDMTWNNMNGIASKENYTASSGAHKIVKHSFIARANYNYKSKYYLTFTGRYDGSSNFAANRKWGFFPSAAFKWNVIREKFMRKAGWIDDLSLRLSYGVTGNDAISAYRSLKAYTSSSKGYLFEGVQSAYYSYARIPNPDLTWEKTALANVGVDFAVLDNRIKLTAEAYYSKTNDLLLTVQTPTTTGFSNRYTNLGETTNAGMEFTVQTRNIVKKKFEWNTTLTLSHNRQMVNDIGNEDYVAVLSAANYMMYGYKAGYPLNSLWGFQNLGVIKSKEDIERNKLTKTWATQTAPSLGELKYADQNNDGVLDDNDLIYLGNSDPILHGGFQNNFHIGNFKISFYFAYSLGGKIYNYSQLYMGGSAITNQYRFMLDAWHPEKRPDSDIPRAGFDANEIVPSDYMVYDASYIRLKNASISYNFDFKKNKKQLVKGLTLTLTGDNLWLWSKYIGYDPDVSTESDGSVMRRVDIGAYPKARMVILKANIKF
jgi:TonB-linked SusC/RagA family outer membrane protein